MYLLAFASSEDSQQFAQLRSLRRAFTGTFWIVKSPRFPQADSEATG